MPYERPRQAVILAGGLGTRLRPFTDTCPKPMIEFHGKPFLEYLIEMLRDQGFERVLMLLGHLPEVIKDYFGDGSRWDLSIEYSVSPVDDDTGRRLKLAAPNIDPVFLLMYCDNYWPMPFDSMWRHFNTSGAPAMVTVYRNADGYTRDNLRVGDDSYVAEYDKSRTMPGLQGVDIGFMIFQHAVLDLLPDDNVSLEAVVYPQLALRRQLLAYVTEHRYYSVSTHERLDLTAQFLDRHPTVLLDRDGVLNKAMPQAQYVRSWSEWEWLPGSKEALGRLKNAGYRVIIISNQPGIARGEMSEAALADIHQKMRADVQEAGGLISAIYYCPHGWDDGCECRKPSPGMLFQAQRDFNLDLSRSWFVGDDHRDGQAADAAGCPWQQVSANRSLLDVTRELLNGPLGKKSELQ